MIERGRYIECRPAEFSDTGEHFQHRAREVLWFERGVFHSGATVNIDHLIAVSAQSGFRKQRFRQKAMCGAKILLGQHMLLREAIGFLKVFYLLALFRLERKLLTSELRCQIAVEVYRVA